MRPRIRNTLLVTAGVGLSIGYFLHDTTVRPTYLSADRAEQIERCLAADPLGGDPKDWVDPVQRECVPLLATQNCRAAWEARNRRDPAAHDPARACMASICDEWTDAPRFCRHPDYASDHREAFYYTAHMASAVLGRGLSEREDHLIVAFLDHMYCEGPLLPRPAAIDSASPHFRRTLHLATKLIRLTWSLDRRVPPWRPPDCEPRHSEAPPRPPG